MLKISIIFVLLFLGSFVFSQTYKLSGVLLDSAQRRPLPGGKVILALNSNADKQYYGITDDKGKFDIDGLGTGSYILRINYVGYETVHANIEVRNNVNLGEIFLSLNAKLLNTVQIFHNELPVQLKGDTTVYNSNAFQTNPDATAEDLIEKMPGMILIDGKMQAQGEDVKIVLIDGQPYFGDDPNAALKNIPSEVIDKIQVFDQQSEQAKFTGFDDGNTSKTINIVTKTEFRNGSFGNFYGGYGYENKYSAGGVFNNFNGVQRITLLGQTNNINQQNFASEDLAGVINNSGNSRGGAGGGGRGGMKRGNTTSGSSVNDFLIGMQDGISSTNAFGVNYSDKWGEKINLTSSYFFNQTNNVLNNSLSQFYFTNSDQEYSELETAESTNMNHRFNLRFNYTINRKNSIILNPKFSIQTNKGHSDLMAQTSVFDSLMSKTTNFYNNEIFVWNFSNSLLWRHRFTKRGRSFSINFSQNVRKNSALALLESESNYYASSQFDTTNQTFNLNQFEQTYSASIVYTEPINYKLNLQISYTTSYSINDSEKETYNFDLVENQYSIFDTLLSDFSKSEYKVNGLSTGVRIRLGESMLMINTSFQMSTLLSSQILPLESKINNLYTSILPAAMWRFSISKNQNLICSYRTKTSAPTITQLQEVIDNTNPLQLTIGNSNLSQQYQHNIYLKYSSTKTKNNSMFFVMITGNYTNNYIGNNTIIAHSETMTSDGVILNSGSQLTRLENFDGYYALRAFSTYGMPVEKLKSNLNFNVSAEISHIPGIINDILNTVNIPNFGLGVVLSSNISEKIDFTISSTSTINYTINSVSPSPITQFFNHTSKLKGYWNFWRNLTFRTSLKHQLYAGLSDEFDTNYFLWNLSLGAKMFKNKKGEILFTVYDVLNQNNNLNRLSTETYIQETETMVLGTYAMITFKYSFTKSVQH
ncbi:MAG: hypothetical protein ACI8ZM_004296 [Crocinitomix sp.]|jgi:hypothetical protein